MKRESESRKKSVRAKIELKNKKLWLMVSSVTVLVVMFVWVFGGISENTENTKEQQRQISEMVAANQVKEEKFGEFKTELMEQGVQLTSMRGDFDKTLAQMELNNETDNEQYARLKELRDKTVSLQKSHEEMVVVYENLDNKLNTKMVEMKDSVAKLEKMGKNNDNKDVKNELRKVAEQNAQANAEIRAGMRDLQRGIWYNARKIKEIQGAGAEKSAGRSKQDEGSKKNGKQKGTWQEAH